MPDELLDIYDETNTTVIGQAMKSDAHRDGLWHRAVHVWVYNKKGEILLQKRAATKKLAPNLWDTAVAGHVGVGEDPAITAVREMEEEIGVQAKREDFVFWGEIRYVHPTTNLRQFYHIYTFEYNGNIEQLPLQETEVSALKWFSVEALRKALNEHPEEFTAQGEYWDRMMEKVESLMVD